MRITMTSTSSGRDVLTQTEAEARAARIDDVNYEIELHLGRESLEYSGRVVATFSDNEAGTGADSTFFSSFAS